MNHIRRAGLQDARELANLLNEIIKIGGTTAKTEPVSPEDIQNQMQSPTAVWHLAEDDTGQILGFQYFDVHPDIPKDSVSVATFVRVGITGLGIGSTLFEKTKSAARALGYRQIDAVIRADNVGGRAYYQSRGFEFIKDLPDHRLENGQIVDRVWTRIQLY